ncbi:MAG: hypothetical protein IKJ62_03765 [Alphaproteobacteria bacterium]|nr:hypothetical protein [Alphaproteobacteria bacterium]
MKKILMFALCVWAGCSDVSWGGPDRYVGDHNYPVRVNTATQQKKGCQPVSCNTSTGDDRLNADTLLIGTEKNAASCYICENGYCEDGDIVYDLNAQRFVECKQSYGWIGNDEWRSFQPQLCDENQNVYHRPFMKGDSGLEKIWEIDGIEHKGGEAAGNNTTVHATGKSICYRYRCIGGLNWSVEKGKCVAGESKLPPEEDKKPGDDDKRDDGNGGDDKVNKKQQNCIKSWGTWKNGQCDCEGSRNLKNENGVCVCKDKNYIRDGASKTCKPADGEKEKSECEAASASGAYWDNGECKCRDIRKDFVGGKCTEKADIQKCNMIKGAEWSDSLGRCVCEDSEKMEFNKNMTECVEKAELREKRDAEALIVRVKEIHQKLQKRQAEMKVSVWKDAEGNFNTARLVSDSVAGVVLGTAGGLITSSVVKKNQVENGFEDLKCTVGGQIVADWGDQFRVGIQ